MNHNIIGVFYTVVVKGQQHRWLVVYENRLTNNSSSDS